MTAAGAFREDLLWRLKIFDFRMPPLRERKKDLPILIREIINEKSKAVGVKPPSIPGSEMRRLSSCLWPGNIRQLENVIEKALLLYKSRGRGSQLFMGELADAFSFEGPLSKKQQRQDRNTAQDIFDDPNMKSGAASKVMPKSKVRSFRFETDGTIDWGGPVMPLEAVEDSYIRHVLMHTDGVISGPRGAAALLGMDKTTLYKRLKRMSS